MKILTQKYPKGTLEKQQTDGRYIDEMLYNNLKVLAEVIVNDMTFMGIISSSTLEVGTGKSVFVQQIGEAWIDLVNQIHGAGLPDLSMSNIVFKPKDLIERSFKVPKYSVIILDEWEDTHYWSEMGMSLRQFFRKCRQLNLFMLLIIPNFFQMPMPYAITRSVFFIDVRFEGKFERGYFRFFSFAKKKDLYINGKKTQNYDCVKPDFIGRFTKGYVVDEKEYRTAKLRDMTDFEEKKQEIKSENEIKREMFLKIYEGLKKHGITQQQMADAVGVVRRTGQKWLEFARENRDSIDSDEHESAPTIITNLNATTTDSDEKDKGPQPVVF